MSDDKKSEIKWNSTVDSCLSADIRRLAEIPALKTMSDVAIEALYSAWSEEFYYAGWMNLTEAILEDFEKWVAR